MYGTHNIEKNIDVLIYCSFLLCKHSTVTPLNSVCLATIILLLIICSSGTILDLQANFQRYNSLQENEIDKSPTHRF